MSSLGINVGLYFTGGEPFLNYPLLLEAISQARYYRIPARFVEANGFWCTSESRVRARALILRRSHRIEVRFSRRYPPIRVMGSES
jgi:pyruvate-formate lyase-activating enzyme